MDGSGARRLAQIDIALWSEKAAAHLLERVGFGGTPGVIRRLAAMTPEQAVDHVLQGASDDDLPDFEESGFWDPSLTHFPPSRPAATELAERTGAAMGVRVKPGGNRPLQPVTNRFFCWLRATTLETRRLSYWWLGWMLQTRHPLREKMALFWHGHFATSEEKLRDYCKIRQQIDLLRNGALSSFRELLTAVSKDSAMLVFLDAAQNVKGAPNENFGREVMELFTMGVGQYSEHDIGEAARAFTGWTNDDLAFRFDSAKHDAGEKSFLGRTGAFDGDDILRIILEHDQTAAYVASKIWRFFAGTAISPDLARDLGTLLRDCDYEITPFLRALFLSRVFHSKAVVGTHIKSPVELIVSTYRKLGLRMMPGVPDPHSVGQTLGQILLYPPTVAGWGEGRAWITPGLLFERGNFAREAMFPDMIGFTDPNLDPGSKVRRVNRNTNAGMEITAATLEEGAAPSSAAGIQETFNTRYASLMGWQEAMRRLKPTPRAPAQFSLSELVIEDGAATAAEAVDALAERFLQVPLDATTRDALVAMLADEWGSDSLTEAESYMEYGLRLVAHGIMCAPQYQLA
ncbi:MAG: DUF1800 domain-containing protein [Rhodobacterales bacterium]|nr:DUF1800 domain-containing protein [Rhodobacterales bacterium]